MQFNQGVNVFTPDGKEIGRIERVVMDPRTKLVTHLVIRRGFLLRGDSQEQVVPVILVSESEDGRILLHVDATLLSQFPQFQETRYVVVDEEELTRSTDNRLSWFTPTLYQYPPYGEAMANPQVEPAYVKETETHIPKGTVAVKEGAKVVTRDEKSVGNAEQVLTDSNTNRATHFVITRGLLHKEKKLIPVEWVESFGESELLLAVGSQTIEQLPEFQPA